MREAVWWIQLRKEKKSIPFVKMVWIFSYKNFFMLKLLFPNQFSLFGFDISHKKEVMRRRKSNHHHLVKVQFVCVLFLNKDTGNSLRLKVFFLISYFSVWSLLLLASSPAWVLDLGAAGTCRESRWHKHVDHSSVSSAEVIKSLFFFFFEMRLANRYLGNGWHWRANRRSQDNVDARPSVCQHILSSHV